jgi:hypothetical protein
MRRSIRAARVALLVMAGFMLGAGVAAAQVDVAKVLVGTWKGELQQRTQKGADPTVVLIIKSLKQEDGKWVASARVGPRGSHRGKDWPRAARDRHDGRQASGAVDGRLGRDL